MRDPAYENGSAEVGPDGRIFERTEVPGAVIPRLVAAPEPAPAALSPIFWGRRDAEIVWGGAATGDQDHLSPLPDWTITEPGWHPRGPRGPRGPLVRPEPPGFAGAVPDRMS